MLICRAWSPLQTPSGDGESLVIHEVAEAVSHGYVERLLERTGADEVVVDVRERDPCGGARRDIHLFKALGRRIEEPAGVDDECRTAVPHLVKLLLLRKLSER